MTEKQKERLKLGLRVVEIIIALILLLAIFELLLTYRNSTHGVQPQVKLIEHTEEIVIIKLPPNSTTNAPGTTKVPNNTASQPQVVAIKRQTPPLLSFVQVRRWLGLLPPAPPETVTAYRRNERVKTVEFPGTKPLLTKEPVSTTSSAVSGTGASGTPPTPPPTAPAVQPDAKGGDPFRISLPQ